MKGVPTSSLQPDLFGEPVAADLPRGVIYRPDIMSRQDEIRLAAACRALDLAPFAYRGFTGKRHTASFGWRYDFNGGGFQKAEAIPAHFLPWRDLAASVAQVEPDSLEQMLAIAYAPGAGIGWHRDRPQFGIVAALSVLAPCRMRFRRPKANGWERKQIVLAPRSGYALDGEGRDSWEHSIPEVEQLRYSLTFRTLRQTGTASSRRPIGKR